MQDKRRWLPSWQRVELVELCLEQGFTRRQAAAWRRVSVSTVQYWIERYRAAGDAERASGAWAQDRPSTPHRQPARVSEAGPRPRLRGARADRLGAAVDRLRARDGPRDGLALPARAAGCRAGRGRRARRSGALSGRARAICCRWTPSALRASRGPGTRSPATAHRTGAEKRMQRRLGVLPLDRSTITRRLAYTEIHRDEKAATVAGVRRSARSRSSPATASRSALCRPTTPGPTPTTTRLRELLAEHGIRHRTIPPRTPKRNGKVERYQQTLAREWAYGQRYRSSRRPSRSTAHLAHPLQHHPQPQLTRNRPPISRVRNDPRHNI